MSLSSSWDQRSRTDVVTFIPGYSENSSEEKCRTGDGRPKNSAIPLWFDDWFHGDFRRSISSTLGDPDTSGGALGKKCLEEYPVDYPNYRVRTSVHIGMNTTGRRVDDYTVAMATPSSLSPITLEGGLGEPNPFRDGPLRNIDGGRGVLHALEKGPRQTREKFTVQSESGRTVEGVRGSIIYGGSDTYLARVRSQGITLATLASLVAGGAGKVPTAFVNYFLELPAFYAFVDYAFTADGAKLVRVWDASRYPAHALFVDGSRRDTTTFREGEEWTRNGRFDAFFEFGLESVSPGITPFESYNLTYRNMFKTGFGDHPAMDFEKSGSEISFDRLKRQLDSPLFP